MTQSSSSKARIVRPDNVPRIPWINGAGYTRHIGSRRNPALGDEFMWRLSLADLNEDSAFSCLPGIDRIFTLASTGNVELSINGQAHRLGLGKTAEFPGEADVHLRMADQSPQLGLNLMTNRNAAMGSVSTKRLDGPVLLDPRSGVVAVTVLDGSASLSSRRRLDPLATLILDTGAEELFARNCLLAIVTVRSETRGTSEQRGRTNTLRLRHAAGVN
ncbi:HutD family protein [Paenarthrobacter sp. NPDC090522]|uniref:HutD/Ves family protein n=1 Tax=Paenarthrobacter sp. NPDC090522 TaxID=3364383 RepID=UPI0037F84DC4